MKVYTVFEASRFCGVSAKTIANWIESGHIEAFRTVGGHRRIHANALAHFMEEKKMPVPPELMVEGEVGEENS